MIIGIVSDTHGLIDLTRRVVRIFESLEVNLVVHCGDIGPAVMIELFGQWPTHFVLGNCDHQTSLPLAIESSGQTCHGGFGSLELEGKRIAFLHGDNDALLRKTVRDGRWDLVCHGHSHTARTSTVGRTLVVNPGALCRANPPSAAVIHVPSLEVVSVQP